MTEDTFCHSPGEAGKQAPTSGFPAEGVAARISHHSLLFRAYTLRRSDWIVNRSGNRWLSGALGGVAWARGLIRRGWRIESGPAPRLAVARPGSPAESIGCPADRAKYRVCRISLRCAGCTRVCTQFFDSISTSYLLTYLLYK